MVDEVKVDLVPNLDEQVGRLPVVEASSMKVAEAIAERAREIAPHLTSAYADGISAQSTRAGARVFASDEKSAWIEFGIPSRNQPAHWTLRTAVESLGLKFKKTKSR